jgi:hypothetical protein
VLLMMVFVAFSLFDRCHYFRHVDRPQASVVVGNPATDADKAVSEHSTA